MVEVMSLEPYIGFDLSENRGVIEREDLKMKRQQKGLSGTEHIDMGRNMDMTRVLGR